MTEPSSQGFETSLEGLIEPSSQGNIYDQQQEQQKELEPSSHGNSCRYDQQQDEQQKEEETILCLASDEKSRIRIALEPFVPINSPAPWIAINSVCCLGSVFLIHQVLRTAGPVERPYGTQEYISWNLVTTSLWVIEGMHLTIQYIAVQSRAVNMQDLDVLLRGLLCIYLFQSVLFWSLTFLVSLFTY